MSKDKRRQPRLDANLFADLMVSGTGESVGRGVVVDVSLTGCGLDSEVDLSLGTVLDCRIEIPLEFKLKVVRHRIDGQMKRYGCIFVNQGFFNKILLRKLLKGQRQTRKISL